MVEKMRKNGGLRYCWGSTTTGENTCRGRGTTAIRLILIFVVGVLLIYLTYKSKYQSCFFFDTIIWVILILIGIFTFLWTIIKEIRLFNKEKRLKNFSLTFLCIFFVSAILTLEIIIVKNFKKPTLLNACHTGSLNAVCIDFKTDGTYIFNNSSVFISDYIYGTYKISGNKITIDRDTIEKQIKSKYLQIRKKEIEDKKTDFYLFQVDSTGTLIKDLQIYKVLIDNRK
jgi:hypothetical protein